MPSASKNSASNLFLAKEDQEQAAFVQWFHLAYPRDLILHIPNGGERSKRTAAMLKRTGVVRGIPDLFIPSWGLWVEMKRKKGGSVSKEQKETMFYLESCGYKCLVAKGFDHARAQVLDFKFNEKQLTKLNLIN